LGEDPDPKSTLFLGALREAVAALGNLVGLLAAPSIGPRELAALFSELEQNCTTWREQTRSVPDSAPVNSLFDELERIASAAVDGSRRAKLRLELERDFRELAVRGQELLARFEQSALDFS
jgi:hypothetical protein